MDGRVDNVDIYTRTLCRGEPPLGWANWEVGLTKRNAMLCKGKNGAKKIGGKMVVMILKDFGF